MEIKHELRPVDRNTIILWVNVGQNIFVYRNGANTSNVFNEITLFQKGQSRFATLKDLYDWAFDYLGYKK